MRIQYASDLHLEYPKNRAFLEENPLQAVGDILVLAGDIITDTGRHKIEPLYAEWQRQFKYVISIPGNHKFYGSDVAEVYPTLNQKLGPNHYLVNNQTLVLDGVRFVTSILWTHGPEAQMKKLEKKSNDYRLIHYGQGDGAQVRLRAADVSEMHAASVQFLTRELGQPFSGKTVVITHHLPSYNLMGFAAYTGILKYYCASNLNRLIRISNVDYWICGHLHQTIDRELHGTRFLSNPLGYMSEGQHHDFSRAAYFEV
jgi:predicted phosphodiesterase